MISKRDIQRLKKLERKAYPPVFRQMQEVESFEDLCEYCEGLPNLLFLSSGYFLWTDDEIVDLAMTARPTMADVIKVLKVLRSLRGQVMSLDARDKTSWRLIQRLEEHGFLEILSHQESVWGEEVFHEVTVEVCA